MIRIVAVAGRRVVEILDQWSVHTEWWKPTPRVEYWAELKLEDGHKVVIHRTATEGIGWRRHSWIR